MEDKNTHHLVAKSRWGTNSIDNLLRIQIRLHDAINILFWNATPQEQLLKVAHLNISTLTEKYANEVFEVLTIKDPNYIYKKWVYVPNRENDIIYKKEKIYL